jgi:hypothetical protein
MPQVAYELNQQNIEPQIDKCGSEGEREWLKKHVSDILKNKLYTGRYQVADVDEQVPEYRIIGDSLYQKVKDTRRRFCRYEAEKKSVSSERKEKITEAVVSDYFEYLE